MCKNNDPRGPCRGRTGRKSLQLNPRRFARRLQPPPREPRKVPTTSQNHPEGFRCAWCDVFYPWSLMAGFDRRLKFCDTCVRLMDALEIGLTAMTTNVSRSSV